MDSILCCFCDRKEIEIAAAIVAKPEQKPKCLIRDQLNILE